MAPNHRLCTRWRPGDHHSTPSDPPPILSRSSRSVKVQNNQHYQLILGNFFFGSALWMPIPTHAGDCVQLRRRQDGCLGRCAHVCLLLLNRYSNRTTRDRERPVSSNRMARKGDGKTLLVPFSAHTLSQTNEEQPCSDTSSAQGAGPRYRPAGRRGVCSPGLLTIWLRRGSD